MATPRRKLSRAWQTSTRTYIERTKQAPSLSKLQTIENLHFGGSYISKVICKGKHQCGASPERKGCPWTLCQGTFAAYPRSWLHQLLRYSTVFLTMVPRLGVISGFTKSIWRFRKAYNKQRKTYSRKINWRRDLKETYMKGINMIRKDEIERDNKAND